MDSASEYNTFSRGPLEDQSISAPLPVDLEARIWVSKGEEGRIGPVGRVSSMTRRVDDGYWIIVARSRDGEDEQGNDLFLVEDAKDGLPMTTVASRRQWKKLISAFASTSWACVLSDHG